MKSAILFFYPMKLFFEQFGSLKKNATVTQPLDGGDGFCAVFFSLRNQFCEFLKRSHNPTNRLARIVQKVVTI